MNVDYIIIDMHTLQSEVLKVSYTLYYSLLLASYNDYNSIISYVCYTITTLILVV